MAKWFGKIGYALTQEVRPGVWNDTIEEHEYFGDVTRNSRRLQNSDSTNDNIVISNTISIVADPFAYENFHAIRYAEFMGAHWKVTDIEVQYPRLTLTLGEVYNG